MLRRFMEKPVFSICKKRIFRYIKGTLINRIFYANNNGAKVVGFTDSDWTSDPCRNNKKMLGYAFDLAS